MRKVDLERKLNRAIDKALWSLGGMLHMPTAEAIRFHFINPKKRKDLLTETKK